MAWNARLRIMRRLTAERRTAGLRSSFPKGRCRKRAPKPIRCSLNSDFTGEGEKLFAFSQSCALPALVIQEETLELVKPHSAPDQGPLPYGHGSVNWKFSMIASPFEVPVGTVRCTFPGAETCDVKSLRRSDESSCF